MKGLIFFLAISLSSVSQASEQNADPFALTHFGHFKKIMHSRNVGGVVNLQEALDVPHAYAVGATAGGTGEITVIDSKVWLNYGADGLGNAQREVTRDEMAVLLVRGQVKEWKTVKFSEDMDASKMHDFILDQAKLNNINVQEPFPFMLLGRFYDLDWHVLNGLKNSPAGHNKGGIFKKEDEHLDNTGGTVIGFYSAANQGVFTHPGESWHLHIVFDEDEKAGHLDAISVRQGTLLKLPVSQAR